MKIRKNNLESAFTLIEVIITLVVVAIVAAMMVAYFGTSITSSSLPILRLQSAGKLNQIMEKITADYNSEPATWSPSTTYATTNSSLGTSLPTVILPTAVNRNGYRYICTTGGTSSTTEPAWPTSGTVTDGTVTWTYAGFQPPTYWGGVTGIPNTAYPFKAIVYPANANGYQYICNVAGISGTSAPAWRTDSTPFSDGTVTWINAGPQPTVALQTKIGAEVTGGHDYTQTFSGVSISYRVIQNRFITFDTSNTENDTCTPSSCDMLISAGVTTNVYGKYLKVTIGLPMLEPNRTAETLTTLFVRR